MIKASDIRKGKTIIHEGSLFVCHDAQHVAKGNKRSYMQTKLRNLKSGAMMDVRFSVDDKIDVPFVESKEYEFLYKDGQDYIFMDTTTYDQLPIDTDLIGDGVNYLVPNIKVTCDVYEDGIIAVNLPHTLDLVVKDTPPVVKGATVTNQPKEAVLETGVRVRVPGFIAPGEKIRVDTRSGEYIERAKS
ncbi:MAG: elongation factor P [bacterium]|nr:elongation factor P [bacterium]